MASNLRRSKRTFGQRFLRAEQGIDSSNRRPSPRRIGSRIVTSRNLAPGAVTTVTLASDVSTAIAFAQATADGKNTIYYQTTVPTGGTYAVDDIWFDTDDDHKMYRYNGSAWAAFQLGDNAIAELSADKLTAGTIDANVITVSNLNAGSIVTGTLSGITISGNTITGGTLNIGGGVFQVASTGALTATSATITGTINASSGSITGSLSAGDVRIGSDVRAAGHDGIVLVASSWDNAWVRRDNTVADPNKNTVYFRAGTATTYVLLDTGSGGSEINFNNGTFRVTNAGALTATSATVTGAITATSGRIGPFDVSTTTFSSSYNSTNYLEIQNYGDIYIYSNPTSGPHTGQSWLTRLFGEYLQISQQTDKTNFVTVGNTDGSDGARVEIFSGSGKADLYIRSGVITAAPESSWDNQILRLVNANNNVNSVCGIGFKVGNGQGAVLRAWQGNTSSYGYSGTGSPLPSTSTYTNGWGGSGNGLDVGNVAGTGYGFIGATAFVVRSSEMFKEHIEYLPKEYRQKSVDRIAGLKPARWDDLAPAGRYVKIDDSDDAEETYVLHDCDNEDCGGTSENPCGVYSFHKGRYGFVAEDVAEVFPKAAQITDDNKAIGIDYAVITFSLVETVQVLLEKVDALQSKLNAMSS